MTERKHFIITHALRSPRSLPHTIKATWRNLPIRAKLFLYAATLIALIAGLALYSSGRVAVIQQQQIPARSAAREIDASLLAIRIDEQQFITDANSLNAELYLKRTSASLDSWERNYQKLADNYAILIRLYRDTDLEVRLRPLDSMMKQYRDVFLELSSAYQERGFQTFGREGVLLRRAASLQSSIGDRVQAQLSLSRLQQAQNEFLLYQQAGSVKDFTERAAELRGQLRTPDERVALEEYAHIFQEIVALDEKIGLTNGSGLRGRLTALMAEMTPLIQTVESDVLSATSKEIAAIPRSINIATVILALFAILMALVIARFITRQLQELLKASQRITSGDLQYRIDARTTDEFGRLAGSFDDMAEKLLASRKTLRSRAKALAQSVRRFELVSRAVNEAIYEWDIKTGKLKWGEGLVTVFGYKPHEKDTVIDWWTERVHHDDAQVLDVSLTNRLRHHSVTWKKEYRFRKANGQYVYCQDRSFIEYQNGEPVRIVGSLVDITKQKELERAKDEFISVASHQLRTPLGSIRWNLELLTDKINTLPKASGEYIQEAYKSTLRMLGLVGDLLSVARIEQNRVQDMPQQTDLVEIIMMAISEMEPIARQNNIRIDSTSLKHKKAQIMIDPKRFREVIQNLLSNAVKYSRPNGKVWLSLEYKAEDIVIIVADDGLGIPSEEQGNLFTKFFRAKNVLATDTEGSGLGLFVVKSYVEQWGGRIWLESEANKGTTFFISIPHKPRFQKVKT